MAKEKPVPHPMDEIDANRTAGEFILPLKPKEPATVPAPKKEVGHGSK